MSVVYYGIISQFSLKQNHLVKKVLLLLIVVGISHSVEGQNSNLYKWGYIVFNANQKYYCYIKDLGPYKSSSKIIYRDTIDFKKKKAKPIDVRLYNIGGKTYYSKNSDNLNSTLVFMRRVVDGKIRVYEYKYKRNSASVGGAASGGFYSHSEKLQRFYLESNGKWIKVNRSSFKDLGKLMADDTVIVRKLENKDYKLSDITTIVKDYNQGFPEYLSSKFENEEQGFTISKTDSIFPRNSAIVFANFMERQTKTRENNLYGNCMDIAFGFSKAQGEEINYVFDNGFNFEVSYNVNLFKGRIYVNPFLETNAFTNYIETNYFEKYRMLKYGISMDLVAFKLNKKRIDLYTIFSLFKANFKDYLQYKKDKLFLFHRDNITYGLGVGISTKYFFIEGVYNPLETEVQLDEEIFNLVDEQGYFIESQQKLDLCMILLKAGIHIKL